jgi:hypothetical protein
MTTPFYPDMTAGHVVKPLTPFWTTPIADNIHLCYTCRHIMASKPGRLNNKEQPTGTYAGSREVVQLLAGPLVGQPEKS